MAASGPVFSDIRLRPFQADDEAAFRRLNEEWIAAYFGIEEKDRVTLGDPVGQILQPGGAIFMAVYDNTPIGCCALLWMRPGVFEVAKMAVERTHRGRGIGRKILEYTMAQAMALGATSLYLETSNKLPNAIHLYQSLGFHHVPPERVVPSPYARANVFMEMWL